MVRHDLAIVIPAYNEENTIELVINSVKSYGEVIVIDDGSKDKTANKSKNAGAIVHSHLKNYGYDESLNTGFKIAKNQGFEFVITMDADGQHNANSINKIKKLLNDGFDVVVTDRSYKQRFSEYLFAAYSFLRWSISDPLSGLKGYRVSLYCALGHFDSYNSIGTELLFFALKNQYKVVQISTELFPRSGESRFGQRLLSNIKILRALFLSF